MNRYTRINDLLGEHVSKTFIKNITIEQYNKPRKSQKKDRKESINYIFEDEELIESTKISKKSDTINNKETYVFDMNDINNSLYDILTKIKINNEQINLVKTYMKLKKELNNNEISIEDIKNTQMPKLMLLNLLDSDSMDLYSENEYYQLFRKKKIYEETLKRYQKSINILDCQPQQTLLYENDENKQDEIQNDEDEIQNDEDINLYDEMINIFS